MDPKVLRVPLQEYGYYMEIDTRKSDCNFESVHWHLCKNGSRIGKISAYGSWASPPDVSHSIRKEAEELTSAYCSEIIDCYNHNRTYGSD